jgi:transcriptional repressor NF-X1
MMDNSLTRSSAACKEDKPCQSKTFITCPCQHRKQEVRCQATKLNPWPNKEATLKCDDECLRLQRNRKLAEALSIDPDTHNDDHIPYSDTTLKLFRENINWAQEREREFRGFAAAQDEKRLRFKPMQSHQRAFLHALAADFGLDSESQDPEPHRHVCVFKTPRFVSAPRKTLAQCLRIAKTAANLAAAASSLRPTAVSPAPHKPEGQAFNALLLKEPRFGLTIDELDDAIAADLASAAARLPLTFTTSFLPSSEEIVIKATSKLTAAAIATSLAPTPQAIESTLSILKSAVARTVSRLGLVSGGVSLCHADGTGSITRREGDGPGAGNAVAAASTDGWSAVASRGSWRRTAAGTNKTATAPANLGEQRAPSAFVALRRLELKKKKAEKASRVVAKEEPVEEDWLVAAEKLVGGEEEEEGGLQEKGSEGSESEGGSGTGSGSEDGLGVAGDTLKDGVGDGERGGADQGVKREHEEVPAVGVDGPAVALRLV